MREEPIAHARELLPEALDFLRRMVAENSHTGNRAGVTRNAGLVAEQFAPLGFTAEQVPAENPSWGDHLFLSRPGHDAGKGLLLATHLDTVFTAEEELRNAFHWQEEEGRIYGPGVIDNKGGTAMIWLVLSVVQRTAPEIFASTHWLVAANAAEEELARDFPRLCRERMPRDCRGALVFESCAGQEAGFSLVESRKGSANLRVIVEGRGAHAGSRHHEGANAILALSRVIERVSALTDYERKLTVNVGWISGGGAINRVPHEAICEINIRAFEEEVLQSAVDAIEALKDDPPLVQASSDGYPCRIHVETLSRNPTWPENAQTAALLERWRQAARQLNVPLHSEPRGGLSDGNYLSQFLPTLDGLGPFGRNGHASERSPDGTKLPEHIEPESLASMGAVNATAILGLLEES